MNYQSLRLLACLVFCLWSQAALGDTTQSITLQPGWNAVYLQVDPELATLPDALSGLPIERLAMHLDSSATAQFITNPGTEELRAPEWLIHIADASVPTGEGTLAKLLGGRVYLIKLGGQESVSWTVSGTPVLRRTAWNSDAFTLVGLSVGTGKSTRFSDYFSGSDKHTGLNIKRLSAEGIWTDVDAASAQIEEHAAYWVYTDGASSYQGPFEVALPNSAVTLDFGSIASETEVKVRNNLGTEQEITLSLPASDSVQLSYWSGDFGAEEKVWTPLEETKSLTLAPDETRIVKLAVRRESSEKEGDSDLLSGTLALQSDSGSEVVIPIKAAAKAAGDPLPGLWAGEVILSKVSEHVRRADGSATPQLAKDAGSPFQFRILLHVAPGTKKARLLPQVTQVVENSQNVLYTDDVLFAKYAPDAIPADARRLSSAAFGVFLNPVTDADTNFPAPGGTATLELDVVLDFDDPLNPFKHRYHPDHNNLDGFDRIYTSGGQYAEIESFTVSRKILLTFSPTIKEGLGVSAGDPSYGEKAWTGDYQETIGGLMRDTTDGLAETALNTNRIVVNGVFVLRHVSGTTTLNPAP